MTDERALKLARELAAQDAESHGAIQTAIIFREGGADDSISIRVALAAIKLTTQLAAEYLRKARTEVWIEGGRFDSDDKAHPVLLRGDGIGMAAEMLEDFEHLPADGGENV